MRYRSWPAVWILKTSVCLLLAAVVCGCGLDLGYILPAVSGQLNIYTNLVPLDQAAEDPNLTDEQRAKIDLVRAARLFARDTIGLYVENNYADFYNSNGATVAYNLSASHADRLEPLTWSFPIAGTLPHLGYFDLAAAQARAKTLRDQGYDVYIYELDAYSLGAGLPDPLFSTMLERDEVNLVDTVIHELLHATIGRENREAIDAEFNETLATFVGRRGAIQFFESNMPDRTDLIDTATDRFEDSDRFGRFMAELYDELSAYYASTALSREDKLEGRAAIFEAGIERFFADIHPLMNVPQNYDWVNNIPVNNAYVLLQNRYNANLGVIEDLFVAVGGNWPVANNHYRDAAAFDGNPFDYLRNELHTLSSKVSHVRQTP
jgi:predicted aminopeptidase